MCGGVARWLRLLGVDTSYTPGIDDGVLVAEALAEGRVVVSADNKLFERRLFTTGQLSGVHLPVGLKLLAQVEFVVGRLDVTPRFPRCSTCNGTLVAVARAEVAGEVPARSLIWLRSFYRCGACGQVFWEGTHWRRIGAVRARLEGGAGADIGSAGSEGPILPTRDAKI